MRKSISSHPKWYYKKFDEVFFDKERCRRDIELVDSLINIQGKVVKEVGAGTGNHALEILHYQSKSLCLVDIDPKAVKILSERFSSIKDIVVSCEDGLNFRNEIVDYNLILCMYSIVQQSVYDFDNFFLYIKDNISEVCAFVFEFIDKERSENIYPSNVTNKVYSGEDGTVYITSFYNDNTTTISFRGTMEKGVVDYTVNLTNLTKKQLNLAAEKAGLKFKCISLDGIGRRCLACLEKL